jgi:PAS domain S-box-containing protein
MVLQQHEPSDAAPPQTIIEPAGNVIRAGSRGRVSDRAARRSGLAIPYRAVLEHAPYATVITDQEGYITFVNQQTELLFGYTRAELLGEPVEQLIPARFQIVHRQRRAAYNIAPHARPLGTELKLWGRRASGEEFPVEVSLNSLEASGAPLIIATIRDISERLRLETSQANAEATSEELRRLQAITDAALAHPELEGLVPELLDRIGTTLAVNNVAILLASDDGQMLTLFAAKGPEAEVGDQVLVPVGQGVAGSIAATRSPLIVDDLAAVRVVNPWLQREVRSLVGVPLIAHDQLIGVLHADSTTRRRFTSDDVRLLQLVGERIAYAIANARLRATEQKAHLEVEAARIRVDWLGAQLDHIFEGIADGVVIYDADGTIVRTNAAARHILGLDAAPPQYGGMTADERASLFAVYDEENHPLRNEKWPLIRVLSGKIQSGIDARDVRMRTLDGREVEVNTSAAPLYDAAGRLVGAVTILRNQTEERRLAREREAALLREQEARLREEAALDVNQRMEQFLATASHDLRNPVTAALGSVQMAQRRARNLAAAPGADAKVIHNGLFDDLERANHALHRLNRLVGRLFDLTQVQLGQMELKLAPENLSDLVRAAVEAQRAVNPERTIHLQVPEDRPVPVFVDADRIDQVLTNYLANAVKYSPAYRPITVHLEVEEVEAGRQARVSVEDHGPGVPAAEQAAIWELHHRVAGVIAESEQTGSLGLGLYLCKNLVERHEGQVGINSVPKRGATFWFTLPLTSL